MSHRIRVIRTVLIALACLQVCLPNAGLAQNDTQALFEAVQSNNVPELKRLVKNGVDVNSRDDIGQTALMHACTQGYKESAAILLSAGADIDAQDAVGGTALMYAGLEGREDAVRLLLDKGADVHVRDVMQNTALIRVAARGRAAIAQLLVENGADVNAKGAYGMAPLMWAVAQGDSALVLHLLRRGADVNAAAKDGITALMIAAGPVRIEEKGPYGSTGSVSVDGGNENMVKLLLEHKADVNAGDARGNTAVFYANKKGDGRITLLLRSHGAE